MAEAKKTKIVVDELVGAPVKTTEESPTPSAPARSDRFSGVVDSRMIPDAGMPTEEVSGVLDTDMNGHGLLRPAFSFSDFAASAFRSFLASQPTNKNKNKPRIKYNFIVFCILASIL